jgi:hypothetical protein
MTAAVASGLLSNATLAIATPAAAGVVSPGAPSLAALAVLIALAALPVRDARERWRYVAPVVRCIVAALATWTAAGVIVAFAFMALPGSVDASLLSTIRTIVLVAAAVAVAAAGSHPAGREAAWLTYPLLLVAGLKLVFVDFMQGRPTTLFAALAVYGAGLIIAPRMLRREVAASNDAVAPAGCGLSAAPITSAHPQTTVR